MNIASGFMMIMLFGIAAAYSTKSILEINGFSQTYVMVAVLIMVVIFVSIPLILVKMKDDTGADNNLEKVGRPLNSLIGLVLGSGIACVGLAIMAFAFFAK